MRALPLMVLVSMGAVGACSGHPLTGDMTGTGGEPTGAGGSGGQRSIGAGGSAASACNELADEYKLALAAARSCDVGAAGQCEQPVNSALSVCGSCPAFVTDSSKLDMLQQLWEAANCAATLPSTTCIRVSCPIPADVCLPTDGGTRGVCSYAGAGTGGNVGTGGAPASGGSSGAGAAPGDAGLAPG